MSDQSNHTGITRRRMIAGAAAATGAVGLASAGLPEIVSAGPPTLGEPTASLPTVMPRALAAPIPGLTYIPIDAVAFGSATENGRDVLDRLRQPSRRLRSSYLYTSLPIPVGGVFRQLNVLYRGTPIVFVDKRGGNVSPFWESVFTTTSLPLSLTPNSQSYDVNIPIEHGYTYSIRVYAELDNGITMVDSSIIGVSVGYVPVASGFVPFTGPNPRILDTRQGGGKVLAGDAGAREINFNVPGAKAAIINLTADATEAYGYFSVFPANVPWPGNSSVNWTGANVTIANNVVAPLSPDGKIKLRAGESAAHAIVDVQGFLF